jgi:hypothetical protein
VDTLTFTVTPGAATGLRIAPKDTVVHVTTPAQFRGAVLDRFNNPRLDPVTFSSVADPAGIGSVDGSGAVVPSGVGRLTVVAANGAMADTAHLTSAPFGQFAAYDNQAFVVADLDGTIIKPQFGPGSPPGFEPAWTSDGQAIVIAPFNWPIQIGILHLDGQVESLSWDPAHGPVDPNWPSPSADGRFIYFSASGAIWRVTRDGSRIELVVAGDVLRPSVSPDGKGVTFQGASIDGTAVIRVYDIPSQQLRGPDVPGHFPEWGSGGIAFFENSTNRIKLMTPDGTGARFLTPVGRQYFDDQLAWSPDGQWILARGAPSLELINVTTGQILPLLWSFNLYEPTWRPGTGQAGAARP